MDISSVKREVQEKQAYIDGNRDNPSIDIAYASLRRSERLLRALLRNNLQHKEHQYLNGTEVGDEGYIRKYKAIIDGYLSYYALDARNRSVPNDYYIYVEALDFCGVLRVGDKFIEVREGSLYYVRKKDVHHLISSGKMKRHG